MLSAQPVQTFMTKEITVGESPTNKKKRTALAILFGGPSRAGDLSRRDPSTSLFAVSAAGANIYNEGDNRR